MAVQARREQPSPLAALLNRPRPSITSILGLVFVLLVIVWLIGNFVKDPAEFVSVFLIGLTNGAVYALVALGYTLVYGILQLINFAHGDVFALSGLFASTVLLDWFGATQADTTLVSIGLILTTLVIVMTVFALVNTTIERVAYRPLRSAPRLAALITAVGMSFIVQNVGLAIYDVGFYGAQDLIPRSEVFTFGGIAYTWNKFSVLLITIPVLIALTWFVTAPRTAPVRLPMPPRTAAVKAISPSSKPVS